MINPEIDLFLSFFPWQDCRIYHNSPFPDGEERTLPSWKEVILNSMPTDSEYLVKSTYSDAVMIVSEYLLFRVDQEDYYPSISEDYFKLVLNKAKEEKAECPYHLLLAQIFQAYFHFFHHEELYHQFLKWSEKQETSLEVLSNLFEVAIRELEAALTKLSESSATNKNRNFLSEMLNGALAALKPAPSDDQSQECLFRLPLKSKRNNPWGSTADLPSKASKLNEESKPLTTPYYPMPSGKLPLLSQAVSLVLSEEFHFDRKPVNKLFNSRNGGDPEPSNQGGIVHRRQKIKRKRFRLVFYDDLLAPLPSTIPGEGNSKLHFDPYNFDEDNPAIKKSGFLALKGVVALTNTRFRVQLNAFKHEKKKFSRNTCDLNEVACQSWYVCLLVSDSPPCLSQQMRIGNYQSLVQLSAEFNYFRNPLEYFVELGRQILMFSYSDDCFPKTLIEMAIHNFENLTMVVAMNEEIKKEYEEKAYHIEGAEPTKEQDFWRCILELFKTGKSIKQCNFDFFTLFKKCPQTPIPPKIYMSKEE